LQLLQQRTKVLFELLTLGKKRILIIGSLKESTRKKKKKENFVDEVKTPQGAPEALISPKFGRISPWTCYCCKKTTNKVLLESDEKKFKTKKNYQNFFSEKFF
jgi:hypothetical protein